MVLGIEWLSATPAGILGLVVLLIIFGQLVPVRSVRTQIALIEARLLDSQRREKLWEDTARVQAEQIRELLVVGTTIEKVLKSDRDPDVPTQTT